ncbi:MAG: tRNA uridine-5-carboxymethylaminomethyl(34) synthesis GTPase MnmE [Acidiferrobacteraceae bacterium]|jgi:tRNA modification GTPase|nr:tRNA uridine-5-carboxymethylaminomethyl(34) synthesis GTPase MnmE [Acidiferrobacteraceae bacterium]MDP6433812.1 tRNA uridine-5-carboxymethylaminomethyl(34) synthesis GTPase MnmE [Arenicellales bacterium]MDP6672848.1 tRNA uridine-5-carboxymethylaminomethyl(34) synthesis GTPase MnmE [Arenicellales bacterium]MDP6724818.1 tRNA uridine-5-carboxymethylaminomethyl(34) synthesis GTPase MnmE [Arenicellales bacterium]|tara:strand:- start:20147 stop:21514 length:1368 start_codon:yes stop_codon:yes gene_type:complete
MTADTIVAIATPAGRGGVGIVRLSGPVVKEIATQLIAGTLPNPREAAFRRFVDTANQVIDEGLIILFNAPASYTGEDVVELHSHGSPIILDHLLGCAVKLGARLAGPGEFTQRAYLNGRIDLTQAEAVADLIASDSLMTARAAVRSLQGEFSAQINTIIRQITDLRVEVEASIDFPDEELEIEGVGALFKSLCGVEEKLTSLLSLAKQGQKLQEGAKVVIAGPPNAGKSSLLNILSGIDHAIVSPTPGTTRDLLLHTITLDGLTLDMVDTAGLREPSCDVEEEGVARAVSAAAEADHVLLLVDDSLPTDVEPLLSKLPEMIEVTRVDNKIDLSGGCPGPSSSVLTGGIAARFSISAKTGEGLPQLREHLKKIAGYSTTTATTYTARRRHVAAIEQTLNHVRIVTRQLVFPGSALEEMALVAEELRLSQSALEAITGRYTAEMLLDEIFSGFCIGK